MASKKKPKKPRVVRAWGWLIRDVNGHVHFTSDKSTADVWKKGYCPVVPATVRLEVEQ